MRTATIAAGLTLAFDQVSKIGVVHLLDLKTRAVIDVLPPLLTFRMAWNRGVNFGLFSSHQELARWFLIGVALVICTFVVWWARREGLGPRGQVFAGLVLGGAIGNVIDRLIYGAVADFLNVSCCGFSNPWAFNIADVAIFAGALGLAFIPGPAKSSNNAS